MSNATIRRPELGAHEVILDRPEAESAVKTHFADELLALQELVDYGTHLIPRCWASSNKKMEDMVVLTILLKQALALLDGAQVLVASGCVPTAWLQLRALFEVSIDLDWILARDTERRARAYFVVNLRRRLTWVRRMQQGTSEHKWLQRELQTIGGLDVSQMGPSAKAEVDAVTQQLNRKAFRQMNAAFTRRRRTRSFDPKWYVALFPRKRKSKPTLYTLALRTKRTPQYRVIYERGSETMHSSSSYGHVEVNGGKILIHSLRELSETNCIAVQLAGQALVTYSQVLGHYRPAELANFGRRYVQGWQRALLTRKIGNYEYTERSIG
jgi:Family of unknown function (DUF5677)